MFFYLVIISEEVALCPHGLLRDGLTTVSDPHLPVFSVDLSPH